MELDRLPDDQREWLEERAPLEGLDVDGLLRLVVEHAMLTMRPGWRPGTDFRVQHRRARVEAEQVARRLAAIERERPGYLDTLSVLPEDQQTEQIRREVHPDATTACVPLWATGFGKWHVVVPHTDGGTSAVAKVPPLSDDR